MMFGWLRSDFEILEHAGWAKRNVPTQDTSMKWWTRFALPTLPVLEKTENSEYTDS